MIPEAAISIALSDPPSTEVPGSKKEPPIERAPSSGVTRALGTVLHGGRAPIP
jgi:hypothetical protein